MTAGVSLPDAPPAVADRAVFSANGVTFTVADLVRRAGVGNREAFVGTAHPGQAEEHFRRSRGLLRADQLESWLASWHIAADDFQRWTHDASSGTSTATGWCTLLCSGEFDAITAELASAAAAACELGSGPAVAATFDPADWTARLVERRTTPEVLASTLEAHQRDWTRLTTLRVVTPHRGTAEELRHQVLTDGADLRLAAAEANCEVQEITSVLGDLTPAPVRAALAGARTGDLVGPVGVPEGWTVISVVSRTAPSLADPESRARATAAVASDVITRALAQHVVA